ncbi:MAG: adenosylcobinamide-phosphate synthase CbiB [Bryobacteraceae bacterium]
MAGILFWICVLALACFGVWLTLPWLTVYWIWTLLALRSLDLECEAVVTRLNAGDLEAARAQLAMIVGRDTAGLVEPDIVRAVVETMSENLNDAVIAPLFYLALAGPVAMAGYKAANTLDSMVGYKSDRYRDFGWFSARMDDIASFIPARVSVVLVWLAALLLGMDSKQSYRITIRDAASQPSPNSGYPEAAFAGALGVQLGGLSFYAGEPTCKAFLGEPRRPLTPAVVRESRKLLYTASSLMILSVWMVMFQWR